MNTVIERIESRVRCAARPKLEDLNALRRSRFGFAATSQHGHAVQRYVFFECVTNESFTILAWRRTTLCQPS